MQKCKIGIIGFGTVEKGIFRILKIPFPTVPKPMIPILHFCICYL